MAMILDAFVGRYIDQLSEFVEGEMTTMLGVKDELKKLQRRMKRISDFLESAERRRYDNQNIDSWVRELKDAMYDADDIMERCMIEGRRLLEDHPSESESVLPPLGLLPQLKSLFINEAHAIKTIGPEFLGPCASSAATSFPKLEQLGFRRMDNWEEWSFGMVEGVGKERRGAPKLLKNLILTDCPKLRTLPPLGLLPELKYLRIEAGAIKAIGPEFLGPRASSAATSFLNLEELQLSSMSNWEEWSFGMVEGVDEERSGAPKLLPHLRKLEFYRCHKLRALPEGLRHATNLQELKIINAYNLKEINNLPSLKSLKIKDCPRLEHVKNLDKLHDLDVILSHSTQTSTTDADGQTERLPQWLLELLGQHSLQEFKLRCSLPLLKTFLKDGPNWPIIQPIPLVEIKEDSSRRSSYIRYTMDPPSFEANVVESEELVD